MARGVPPLNCANISPRQSCSPKLDLGDSLDGCEQGEKEKQRTCKEKKRLVLNKNSFTGRDLFFKSRPTTELINPPFCKLLLELHVAGYKIWLIPVRLSGRFSKLNSAMSSLESDGNLFV